WISLSSTSYLRTPTSPSASSRPASTPADFGQTHLYFPQGGSITLNVYEYDYEAGTQTEWLLNNEQWNFFDLEITFDEQDTGKVQVIMTNPSSPPGLILITEPVYLGVTLPISGTATRSDGSPLPNGTAKVFRVNSNFPEGSPNFTISNVGVTDGTFALQAPAHGEYYLVVSDDNGGHMPTYYSPGASSVLDSVLWNRVQPLTYSPGPYNIRLVARQSLSGEGSSSLAVFGINHIGPTPSPLSGLDLHLIRENGPGSYQIDYARLDENGSFSFDNLEPGQYVIQGSYPGAPYASSDSTQITISLGVADIQFAYLNALSSGLRYSGFALPGFSDRDILEQLYYNTGGHQWLNSENWLSELPLDQWYGIRTDGEGRVTQILLSNNRLNGELPGDLGFMSTLERVELHGNRVRGPFLFHTLPNINYVNIGGNHFSPAMFPPDFAVPPGATFILGNQEIAFDEHSDDDFFFIQQGASFQLSVIASFFDSDVLSDVVWYKNESPMLIIGDESQLLFESVVAADRGGYRAEITHPALPGLVASTYTAQLVVTMPISGTVTLNGVPYQGAAVAALGLNPNFLEGPMDTLGTAFSKPAGDFTLFAPIGIPFILAADAFEPGIFPGYYINDANVTTYKDSLEWSGATSILLEGTETGPFVVDMKSTRPLPPGANTVQGQVRLSPEVSNDPDEEKLQGIFVYLLGGTGGSQFAEFRVTDPSGAYLFDGVADGAYTLAVTYPGVPYANGEEQAMSLAGGKASIVDAVVTSQGINYQATINAEPDKVALITLYNSTGGPNWINKTNWLSAQPLSTWHGITTNAQDQVTAINLTGNGLAGQIPASVFENLTQVTTMNVSNNELKGQFYGHLMSENLTEADIRLNRYTFADFDPEIYFELPANLTLLAARKGHAFEMSELRPALGTDVQLHAAERSPVYKFAWERDGTPLQSGTGLQSITLKNLSLADKGNYQVTITWPTLSFLSVVQGPLSVVPTASLSGQVRDHNSVPFNQGTVAALRVSGTGRYDTARLQALGSDGNFFLSGLEAGLSYIVLATPNDLTAFFPTFHTTGTLDDAQRMDWVYAAPISLLQNTALPGLNLVEADEPVCEECTGVIRGALEEEVPDELARGLARKRIANAGVVLSKQVGSQRGDGSAAITWKVVASSKPTHWVNLSSINCLMGFTAFRSNILAYPWILMPLAWRFRWWPGKTTMPRSWPWSQNRAYW
ncbi:MAG: hypothetical protein HC842_03245, partial [Cytophagales bacterium]|nr:hypothetical protein [Cytophagales bacterium]